MTQWCNFEVLITISGYIFIYLTLEEQVRSLLTSLSVKFQVFTLKWNIQLFWPTLFASYRYKTKAKKLFLKKLLWGRGGYFGMTKLRELLHIFLWKFLEVLVDFFTKFLWVVKYQSILQNKSMFNNLPKIRQ